MAILHFTQIFSTETQLPPHNTIGTVLFASIDHAVVTDGVLERLELRSGMPNYSAYDMPHAHYNKRVVNDNTPDIQMAGWSSSRIMVCSK